MKSNCFFLGLCIAALIPGSTATAWAAKVWTYKQSNGALLLDGKAEGTGYSGHGEGLNNPDKEDVAFVGPIPRGEWKISDPVEVAGKAPPVLRLAPMGHDAHKRTNFMIHGDNAKMDHSASDGCIVLDKLLRQKIVDSGVKKLIVEK